MKRKDLLRKLKEAGFHEVRDDGDHTIYKKKVSVLCRFHDTKKLMNTQLKESLKQQV